MNYSWDIISLATKDQTNSNGDLLENAVVKVQWKRVGTNDDGLSHSWMSYTTLSAEDVAADSFINFFDLTEETVKQWIVDSIRPVDLEIIDQKIVEKFDRKSIITRNPPWS